ncbi:MAG: energy-coupling factor transporter transmembrane component T family protein [Candidatus Heimdallarchaeaceae archaeon]
MFANERENIALTELVDPPTFDPRSKIVFLLTTLIELFYTKNIYTHISLIIVFAIVIYFSRPKIGFIVRSTIFFGFLAGIATTFAYLQEVTEQPFILLLLVFSRFVNSFFLITWFFNTVTPNELAIVLEKLYFPRKILWLLTSIYQFIPILTKEASLVNDVRKMKGFVAKRWNIKKQLTILRKMIKPLFTRATNRGIDLAEAMVLKGYNPKIKRTYCIDRRLRFKDTLLMIISIALCTCVLIWL